MFNCIISAAWILPENNFQSMSTTFLEHLFIERQTYSVKFNRYKYSPALNSQRLIISKTRSRFSQLISSIQSRAPIEVEILPHVSKQKRLWGYHRGPDFMNGLLAPHHFNWLIWLNRIPNPNTEPLYVMCYSFVMLIKITPDQNQFQYT